MAQTVAPAGPAGAPESATRAIPEATVARLTTYLHVLIRAAGTAAGADVVGPTDDGTISSEELAALAGVNSAKLRKDLSYLGSQGTRGVGYDASGLMDALKTALGSHRVYPVVIIGCGHLGSALAGYPGFAGRGYPVSVLLDSDPAKIGTVIAGVPVTDIGEAVAACHAADVVIGVIATPEIAAQAAVDVLVAAGVRSVLNFAPGQLRVPDDVQLRRVDLALELNLLAFHESRRGSGQVPAGVAQRQPAVMPP